MEKIMEILEYRIELLNEIIEETESDVIKSDMETRKMEVMDIMKKVKEEFRDGNI